MTRLFPFHSHSQKALTAFERSEYGPLSDGAESRSDELRTKLQCAVSVHSRSWDGIEIAGWASLSSATTSLRRSLSPRWDAGAPRRDSGSHVTEPRRCGPCPPTLRWPATPQCSGYRH